MSRAASGDIAIPTAPGFDNTVALLTEGYDFIANRCRALGSDLFRTRLLLRPVICMRGAACAALFYDGDRFTRQGAMPPTVLRLLQGVGSVQTLDGPAHRHRKSLFTGLLMDQERVAALSRLLEAEWQAAEAGWRGRRISLLQEVNRLLARVICQWSGLPIAALGGDRLADELDSMVRNAGRFDPRMLAALLRRRRTERKVARLLERIRAGELEVEPAAPVRQILEHRDLDGKPLDLETATVELINILRPTVAIGCYIVYVAMALHHHPQWRATFAAGDWGQDEEFVEEVRRFYPFFPLVGGKVLAPFTWRGASFDEGSWVLLDLFGTNHDPARFSQPDQFKPGRGVTWRQQGHDFIPQGAGSTHATHRCPGEAVTVALMLAAARRLVAMSYRVVETDLTLSRRQYPPLPSGGFAIIPR